MLSLDDLSQAIGSYESGAVSLDQLADWFHAASRGKFGESRPVLDACLAIDAAFSRLSYEGITENEFRQELADAVRPFAPRENAVVAYAIPKYKLASGAVAVAAALVLVGPINSSVPSPSSSAITVAANPLLDIALVSSSIPSPLEAEALLS